MFEAMTETKKQATAPAGLGTAGRAALAMAVAGGVIVGGVVLGGLAAGGQMRSSHLLVTGTVMYVVGAVLGFVHGAALGYFGRDEGVDGRIWARQVGLAAAYSPL